MTQSKLNSPETGDIVLVKFPFSDLKQTKQRPALVLATIKFSSSINLFIIAMITSRIESISLRGDHLLAEWKQAHLLHPSLVRLAKLTTLENNLIVGKLGNVSQRDFKAIRSKLKELLSL